MDREIIDSVGAAQKEWNEEPMRDFYENFIAGYPSRLRIKKILKELGNIEKEIILDVGCEAGHVSREIIKNKKPLELYGIDIIQNALDEFKEKIKYKKYKSKIFLKRAFLQKIPFDKEKFENIICTEVIEHAPRLDKGFSEMSRVLKKGGKLIITFPNEKLREKTHFFIKFLGINTSVEKEVTLFSHNPKKILFMLKKHFKIKKYYRFPFYFPMTNLVVCEKRI